MSRKLKVAKAKGKSKVLDSIPQSPSSELYDGGYESDTVSVEEYLDDKYLSSSLFPKGRVVSAAQAPKVPKSDAQVKPSHADGAEESTVDISNKTGGQSEEGTSKSSKKRSLSEEEDQVLQKSRRYFEEVIDKHELVIEEL
jgi:hypothetical protein